jgi:MFS family permease
MRAQQVGSGALEVGLIFSGAALGALLGGLASAHIVRRFPLGMVAIVMLWVEALAFPLYAIARDWWMLGAIALVESVVAPIYMVAMSTYRLSVTPDRLQGRVSGAVRTVTTGAMSLGAILGGVLLSALGPVALAIACGVWLLALAAVTSVNRTARRAPVAVSAQVAEKAAGSEQAGSE